MLLSIWFTKPSTVGAGSEKSVDNPIFCLKMSKFIFLISRYWYFLWEDLGRIVLSLASTRQWSEISWEASTEVEETSFEGDGVMMRSSKENLSWCVSCLVGELTSCVNDVEWSSLVSSSSCASGVMPGRLKSPQITRRFTISIPRVVSRVLNSLKKTDLSGWRRAINIHKHDVFGFEADVYNLELKRGMGYIV